jgi:hypothetical protein
LIEQRQGHILQRTARGDQIERLKDKAEIAGSQPGKTIGVGPVNRLAIEQIASLIETVETANDIEQGALA